MPAIQDMTIEEIEATMAQLRARKQALKKTGKVAERKIATLARRRERLMVKVNAIDDEIIALRNEMPTTPTEAPRRRGRRPKAVLA
jgi:chromosome segregation ATPase